MRYASPEMFNNKYYGLRHDVWGLGILSFMILANEFPFDGKNEIEIKDQVLNKEPNWSLLEDKKISQPIIFLIQKMLIKDPSKRATIKQVINSKLLQGFKKKEYRSVIFYF